MTLSKPRSRRAKRALFLLGAVSLAVCLFYVAGSRHHKTLEYSDKATLRWSWSAFGISISFSILSDTTAPAPASAPSRSTSPSPDPHSFAYRYRTESNRLPPKNDYGLLYPEEFYGGSSPEGTTIIFNVFKGPSENLEYQLHLASMQVGATVNEIWVTCFGSPNVDAYSRVVSKFKEGNPTAPEVHFISSTYDFKFHGRFILAWMARSKYVMLVDDDQTLEISQVRDFTLAATTYPGVHGRVGHIRDKKDSAAQFLSLVEAPFFVMTEVDYLCGTWFIEQRYLDAFFRERPVTWFTGEDIHLSYAVRKYLGLKSYAHPLGSIYSNNLSMKKKNHTATSWGKPHNLRHELFRLLSGRGMVLKMDPEIDTLVYVDGVEAAETFMSLVEGCKQDPQRKDEFFKDQQNSAAWWRLQFLHPIPKRSSVVPFGDCESFLSRLGRSAMVYPGLNTTTTEVKNHVEGNDKGVPTDSNTLSSSVDDLAWRLCELSSCSYHMNEFKAPPVPRMMAAFNLHASLGMTPHHPLHPEDIILGVKGVVMNVWPRQMWIVNINSGGKSELYREAVVRGVHRAAEELVYFSNAVGPNLNRSDRGGRGIPSLFELFLL